MKLIFLGTGSSYPTPCRGVSSLALQLDSGFIWLFDAGEGTQIQLQKVSVTRKKINKIFITHLHGDHLFGLPGLICTISSQISLSGVENDTEGSQKSLIDIYGPAGLRKFLVTSLSLSRSPLNICFRVHELEPVSCQYPDNWGEWQVDHSSNTAETHPSELQGRVIKPTEDEAGCFKWSIFEDELHVIEAGIIHHRIPSFGFVIKEKDRVGTLLVDKLKALGVRPGPVYGQLKSGLSVILEDGRTVNPVDVLGPSIPGHTVVICGDTSDASPLLHLVSECDVLVHEATHDDSLLTKAQEYGHSTPSQAADFALRIKTSVLLLNHFSQRYAYQGEGSKADETLELLLQQAKERLNGSNVEVHCCHDLFVYELKSKQQLKTR